jgi:hypothetical protein
MTITEPVDGTLRIVFAVIVHGWGCGSLNVEKFFTIETNEIVIAGLFETCGNTLDNMRVSQSHDVEAAEERVPMYRTRTLESHTPSPNPSTAITEAAVAANTEVRFPETLGTETNANDEVKFATSLF